MSVSLLSSLARLSDWRQLPTTPGVYIYEDVNQEIIYVGKAKNLLNRVSSYFTTSERLLGPKTAKLVKHIHTIAYLPVTSETEALLLEASLIKKFKPFYNIASKDDKSPYYIHITSENYPRPIINHIEKGSLAGPFLNSLIPRRILRHFRTITPYCVAPRPVKKPCFYSHLGLCHPCPGSITNPQQNQIYRHQITRLKYLLSGRFQYVRKQLEKQMQTLSRSQDFEAAANVRNHLFALDYLLRQPLSATDFLKNPNLAQDISLQSLSQLTQALKPYFPDLTPDTLTRIEMYDNAHLAGSSPTAAMTVATSGQVNHRHYRHFTIKGRRKQSDVHMMQEVITRRLKSSSLPPPNLIVLDGGKPQLSAVSHISFPCPVIALAKQEETLVIPTPDGFQQLKLPRTNFGLRLLQHLRDEAHRFSRRLHHQHESKKIVS